MTLALTASAPLAAVAQAPVTTQPLAQGEVLAEINALGLVTTRADRAVLSFSITGSGETDAAARADVERNAREIRAMLRARGIADGDIRIQPATSYGAAMVAEPDLANAVMVMEEPAVDTNASAATSASANAPAEIIIRDLNQVEAIQLALGQQGVFMLQGATYALTDDSAARRQARTQAMQNARADAEAYAAALNMRVARVVRVTERLGLDLLGMMASESQALVHLFSPAAMRATGPDVQTMVTVGVDFALAPR